MEDPSTMIRNDLLDRVVGSLHPSDGVPDCGKKMVVANYLDGSVLIAMSNHGFGACI